jgi:hypothetical protein
VYAKKTMADCCLTETNVNQHFAAEEIKRNESLILLNSNKKDNESSVSPDSALSHLLSSSSSSPESVKTPANNVTISYLNLFVKTTFIFHFSNFIL